MKKPLLILSLSFLAAAAPLHAMTEENGAVAAEDDAAEASATEEAAAEDPMQRIRCRNQRVTGSNARRIRVCMTIAEWTDLARNGNRDARRLLDDAQRDSTQRN